MERKIKIEKYGNFATLEELASNFNMLEKLPAVYSVFYKGDKPEFLAMGTGAYFKGENPNVSIEELEENWVQGAQEIYIGGTKNIRDRLSKLIKFGNGQDVGHKGGRYIWQIADQKKLVIAWKYVEEGKHFAVKKELIQEFEQFHGMYPLACIDRRKKNTK